MLEQHATGDRNLRVAQRFVNGPEPAPRTRSTGKLYGFPTVSLALVFSRRTLGLKPHALPRPREAIPPQRSDSTRCRLLPPGPDVMSNSAIAVYPVRFLWRAQGEYFSGGTGMSMAAAGLFDPM